MVFCCAYWLISEQLFATYVGCNKSLVESLQ